MKTEEKELLEAFKLHLEKTLYDSLEIYIFEELEDQLENYVKDKIIPYLGHSPINLRPKISLEYIQAINNLVIEAATRICDEMHAYLENHDVMKQKQCKCDYIYHDEAIRKV